MLLFEGFYEMFIPFKFYNLIHTNTQETHRIEKEAVIKVLDPTKMAPIVRDGLTVEKSKAD